MQRHPSRTLGFWDSFLWGDLFVLRTREIFLFCKTNLLPKSRPAAKETTLPSRWRCLPSTYKGAGSCVLHFHTQPVGLCEGKTKTSDKYRTTARVTQTSAVSSQWWESACKELTEAPVLFDFESLGLSLGSGRRRSAAAVLSPCVCAAEAMACVLCAAFSDAGRSTCAGCQLCDSGVCKRLERFCVIPDSVVNTPFVKRPDNSANSEWFEKQMLNWRPVGRNTRVKLVGFFLK